MSSRFTHSVTAKLQTRAVWSNYSTTVDYTTPDCLTLAAPEDLEAANEALTSIDLSWSPVTGAIEYKVEYMAETVEDWTALENEVRAPGVGPFDASPNGTVDPTVTVTDLICRTNYSFRVSARGNGRLYDSEYGPVSDVLAASTERSYNMCDDRVPSFGAETINDISIDTGETVTPVVLPEATGGDFPLAYSFDNDTPLPEGLEFDDETRILSGTPTMPLCGLPFIYTVTDADPTDPDSDTISFNIFVLDPDIPRPSFNSATVADWTYSITANSTALQLPRATGEFGTLRYSLEPPLPSGMTFDADRLIIYGVPTSTATAREYTYKVRNNADCANTDSDSITFSLDFADPPAHPQFHVRPSGITASGNNEAGTITLSWNPDDNAGYRFQQWDDNTQRFRDIPRDNFTVTCGGRIATACPPDATSAVISGFTASGAYYHKIAGRSGSNPDWIPSSSFTTVTLTISDPQPTFNNATISDMVFIEDRAIDPLTLPIAVGGNGQLDYTLTPDLPDGLSFNPLTRTISGTPDDDLSPGTYTYSVTDSDATNPDTDTIRFKIEVADLEIIITNLPSRMSKDDEVEFTVEVTDTPEIGDIEIVVEAFGGADDTSSTTESDIGFNSTCSDIKETDAVDSDVESHTATFTLHACDAQYNDGGIVKVYLTNNGVQISDAVEVDVIVVPKVTINDLSSPVYEGETIAFTVDVDGLKSTVVYDVVANAYAGENGAQSATNSDLGFNATTCSEVTKSVDVPASSTSHTASFTLHVCDSEYNGGIMTITLVDANENIVAGDWFYLEARPITVSIEADNPFPVTGGTVTERTVTLTAVPDVPTGMAFGYYHWQSPALDDKSCTSVGNAASQTHSLVSATATTKSIRVIVKADATATDCHISEPLFITWDIQQTLGGITSALVEVMSTDLTPTDGTPPTTRSDSGAGTSTRAPSASFNSFMSAASTLRTCVMEVPATEGGGEYSSLAKLLVHYAPIDRETCAVQTMTAVSRLTTIYSTETFPALESQDGQMTPAGKFLATLPGQVFKSHMLNTNDVLVSQFRNLIRPAAQRLREEPTELPWEWERTEEEPLPDIADGCMRHVGVNMARVGAASLPLRIATLNCMIFDIPHRYWIDIAKAIFEADNRVVTDYQRTVRYDVPWLGWDDWSCSLVTPNVPFWKRPWLGIPSFSTGFGDSYIDQAVCQKHDLAWHSLRRMAGFDSPEENDRFIDSAWHPTNKALSDYLAYVDGLCPGTTHQDRTECFDSEETVAKFLKASFNPLGGTNPREGDLEQAIFAFVVTNDHNWPTALEHLHTGIANKRYVRCDKPLPEPDLSFSARTGGVVVSWTTVGDCANTSIESITLVPWGSGGSDIQTNPQVVTNGQMISLDSVPETILLSGLYLKLTNPLFGTSGYHLFFTEDGFTLDRASTQIAPRPYPIRK